MSLLGAALRRDVLRLAVPQMAFALLLLLAGALLAYLAWSDRNRQRVLLSEAKGEITALETERAELEQTLEVLATDIDRFRRLEKAGFVGSGDRLGWTEALLRVHQRLGLPEIGFELAPQIALEPAAVDPALADAGALPEAPYGPLAHDLRVQLAGVHEGEVLALLDGLAAEGVGFFRPQSCQFLREADAAGIRVDCTLRWITYQPRPPEADEAVEAGAP